MVSVLDQKFQDAEQRFLEVMYGTKKVKNAYLNFSLKLCFSMAMTEIIIKKLK